MSPLGGTNTLFLFLFNPVPACLAVCLPPPNSSSYRCSARIADKAFYQQPDADTIGYVYVAPWLCRGSCGGWPGSSFSESLVCVV